MHHSVCLNIVSGVRCHITTFYLLIQQLYSVALVIWFSKRSWRSFDSKVENPCKRWLVSQTWKKQGRLATSDDRWSGIDKWQRMTLLWRFDADENCEICGKSCVACSMTVWMSQRYAFWFASYDCKQYVLPKVIHRRSNIPPPVRFTTWPVRSRPAGRESSNARGDPSLRPNTDLQPFSLYETTNARCGFWLSLQRNARNIACSMRFVVMSDDKHAATWFIG